MSTLIIMFNLKFLTINLTINITIITMSSGMRKLLPGGLETEAQRRPSFLEEYEPEDGDSSSRSQIDCIPKQFKKKLRRRRIVGMGTSTISY